jgi:hypothetical protein
VLVDGGSWSMDTGSSTRQRRASTAPRTPTAAWRRFVASTAASWRIAPRDGDADGGHRCAAGRSRCACSTSTAVMTCRRASRQIAAPPRSKGWTGDPHSFVTWAPHAAENSMIDALRASTPTGSRPSGRWPGSGQAGIPYTMDEVRHLVALVETLVRFEVPEASPASRPGSRSRALERDPDMLEAAKLHRGDRSAHLGGGHQRVKPHATPHSGGRDRGVPMRLSFRRQPQPRLHRREIVDAHRLHRPPPPAVGATPHQPDLIVADTKGRGCLCTMLGRRLSRLSGRSRRRNAMVTLPPRPPEARPTDHAPSTVVGLRGPGSASPPPPARRSRGPACDHRSIESPRSGASVIGRAVRTADGTASPSRLTVGVDGTRLTM